MAVASSFNLYCKAMRYSATATATGCESATSPDLACEINIKRRRCDGRSLTRKRETLCDDELTGGVWLGAARAKRAQFNGVLVPWLASEVGTVAVCRLI